MLVCFFRDRRRSCELHPRRDMRETRVYRWDYPKVFLSKRKCLFPNPKGFRQRTVPMTKVPRSSTEIPPSSTRKRPFRTPIRPIASQSLGTQRPSSMPVHPIGWTCTCASPQRAFRFELRYLLSPLFASSWPEEEVQASSSYTTAEDRQHVSTSSRPEEEEQASSSSSCTTVEDRQQALTSSRPEGEVQASYSSSSSSRTTAEDNSSLSLSRQNQSVRRREASIASSYETSSRCNR